MESTFTVEDVKAWRGDPMTRTSVRLAGYRGIWFALGFTFEYGDKYSGGLGTYTSNHQPMAVYSPVAEKTFFTYGGTPSPAKRELVIMISYFDHSTGCVPQPVALYTDPEVDDPHDNAAIQIDGAGYVWVFKSGRGTKRPGLIFRATRPHSIDAFELRNVQEFTYPQVWLDGDGGFFLLFAKYAWPNDRGPARNLYWKTSVDGNTWSDDSLLAGFDGHYQTSGQSGSKVSTFFNWHPDSDNDKRTNLYYAETVDGGKTWTTAGGKPLTLPLDRPNNGALVVDYQAQGKCMYTCDVAFDKLGNPVLLYVLSRKGEPGPAGDPRQWTLLHWKDGLWREKVVTTSDHNYDMGSLTIEGEVWKIIGPTLVGPQRYGTGGEMALWRSVDDGATWAMDRQITHSSRFNHSYARHPGDASKTFYAYWADGDPTEFTESRLYFTDSEGKRVWVLPYTMQKETEAPTEI